MTDQRELLRPIQLVARTWCGSQHLRRGREVGFAQLHLEFRASTTGRVGKMQKDEHKRQVSGGALPDRSAIAAR